MKNVFLLTFFSAILHSCVVETRIDSFNILPNTGWGYEYPTSDTFRIDDNNFQHQVFLNLRVKSSYVYSNIHLKLIVTDPYGEQQEEFISLTLADKTGKWLGTGLGNLKTFQVPILSKTYFKKKGKYKVEIFQNMRLEKLQNVNAAGIRVEKQEEIF